MTDQPATNDLESLHVFGRQGSAALTGPPASTSGNSGSTSMDDASSSTSGSSSSSSGDSSSSSDYDGDHADTGGLQRQRAESSSSGMTPAANADLLRRMPLAASSSLKAKSATTASGKDRKRRKSAFPIIPRGQRCGYCHTCLNPRMKKACLTKRAEFEKTMKLSSPDGSDAAPATKRARVSVDGSVSSTALAHGSDELTDALAPLMNSKGGIKSDMTRPFLALMRAQRSTTTRHLFCTIIALTDTGVLRALMSEGVLEVMHEWVAAAKEAISTEGAVALLESALGALLPFPVTLDTMKQHKALTQLLGALRKSNEPTLKARARELVDTWMACAPQQSGGPASGKGPSTLHRQESVGHGSTGGNSGPAGMAAGAPLAKRPGSAPGSGSTVQPNKRARIDQEPKPPHEPAKPGAVDGVHGNHISVVNDNDMFKKATREKQQHRAGFGGRAPQAPTAAKIQQSEMADTGRQPGGHKSASSASSAVVPLSEDGPLSVQLNVLEDESISVSLSFGQPRPPQAPDHATPGGTGVRAGPSAGMRLGSLSRTGGLVQGGSVTRIGAVAPQVSLLAGMALQQSSVGQESVPVRKAATTKRVTWQAPPRLVMVRWFKRHDPPLQARADASLTDAERAAAAATAVDEQHVGFGAAARKEHLNERQELARQQQAAQQEQRAMVERLQAMHPTIAWYEPSPTASLEEDSHFACGEDSVMRAEGRFNGPQRRVTYQSVHHCPDTPLEAPDSHPVHPFGYAEVLVPLHATAAQPLQPIAQQQQQQQMGQTGSQPLLPPQQAAPYAGSMSAGGSLPSHNLLSALTQLKHVLPGSSAAHPADGQPPSTQHQQANIPHYGRLGTALPQQLQFPGPPPAHYDAPPQQQQPQQQGVIGQRLPGGPGPDGQQRLQPLPQWINRRPCRFFLSERGCGKHDACDFMHMREGEDFDVRQLYAEPLQPEPPEFKRFGTGVGKGPGRPGAGWQGRGRGRGRL